MINLIVVIRLRKVVGISLSAYLKLDLTQFVLLYLSINSDNCPKRKPNNRSAKTHYNNTITWRRSNSSTKLSQLFFLNIVINMMNKFLRCMVWRILAIHFIYEWWLILSFIASTIYLTCFFRNQVSFDRTRLTVDQVW